MSNMSLSEFVKRWKNTSADFGKFKRRFMAKEITKITNEAKANTPVQTGALRASWTQEIISDDEGKIDNGMDYATFIEYGTAKGIAAHYMVTKPLEDFERNKEKDFKEAWLKYAREKGID